MSQPNESSVTVRDRQRSSGSTALASAQEAFQQGTFLAQCSVDRYVLKSPHQTFQWLFFDLASCLYNVSVQRFAKVEDFAELMGKLRTFDEAFELRLLELIGDKFPTLGMVEFAFEIDRSALALVMRRAGRVREVVDRYVPRTAQEWRVVQREVRGQFPPDSKWDRYDAEREWQRLLFVGHDETRKLFRVPEWRSAERDLWFDGVLVKKYRQAARNQSKILEAFEEEGWPREIDDPLPFERGLDPKARLRQTVKDLNSSTKNAGIRFSVTRAREGVGWRCPPQAPPISPSPS